MEVGTILDFRGSWSSGLATLVLKDRRGAVRHVPCDNGPTVRALAAIFGSDVIGPGHTVNVAALRGKKVRYAMDDLGLVLGCIAPAE